MIVLFALAVPKLNDTPLTVTVYEPLVSFEKSVTAVPFESATETLPFLVSKVPVYDWPL